jgi:hypothetical protein
MEQNKTGKYFKYAIGEIVLVMVGILLALQVNNWNEEKKQKIEEQELLTNLSVSFKSKLNELENKNTGRVENIKGINKLLYLISSPNETISEDEMYRILGDMHTWYYVNEEFSIIEMLFSSGKINTISNDSLKAQLISWPDKMEEMLEEQRVLKDLVTTRINPLINEYVSFSNIVTTYNLPKTMEEIHTVSPFPNDFSGLLSNRAFEGFITDKKLYLMVNISDSEILIKSSKSILKLINQEIVND